MRPYLTDYFNKLKNIGEEIIMLGIFNCSCCSSSQSSTQEHTTDIIAISDISNTTLKEAIKAKLNNTLPTSFLELAHC